MCLGIPGRVVETAGFVGVVDFRGVRREVRLDIVDEPVKAGDHVLVHVGYAIRRIPDEEVAATLEVFDELLEAEDVMVEVAGGAPPRPPRADAGGGPAPGEGGES